jgi:dihydroorotate dehydrogenase (fumarate)
MRKLLHSDIDVVGVGGIQSGADAFEMILCGAVAVQVGTCHWTEGPKCFDRICSELRSIMAEKGYRTVDDFRGKLRPWSKEGAAVARKARAKARAGGTTGGGGTATVRRAGSDPYAILSAVLAVLVAVLMADKLGVVAI